MAVFKKTQVHLFYKSGIHGCIQLIEYLFCGMSYTYCFGSFCSQRHMPTVADIPLLSQTNLDSLCILSMAVFKKTQIHLLYNLFSPGYNKLIQHSCYDDMSSDGFPSQKAHLHSCRHTPTVADKP